jgi:flavin reductase (DIM6/NTAB) family NADH-FMN oxidoreductase RutF
LPESAEEKKLPFILESPVNLECVVNGRTLLGSPCPFFGEAIFVHVDQEVLNEAEELERKTAPFVYNPSEYRSLHHKIDVQGFTKK